MPNIADFLVPLRQAMDDYTSANYDSMQKNIDTLNGLIKAHQGVQEAKNQYAQAMESGVKAKTAQMLQPYQVGLAEQKIQSDKALEYQRREGGNASSMRAGSYEQDMLQKQEENRISKLPITQADIDAIEKVSPNSSAGMETQGEVKSFWKGMESVSMVNQRNAAGELSGARAETILGTKDSDIAKAQEEVKTQEETTKLRIAQTEQEKAQKAQTQARTTAILKEMTAIATGKGLTPTAMLTQLKYNLIQKRISEDWEEGAAIQSVMDPLVERDITPVISALNKRLSDDMTLTTEQKDELNADLKYLNTTLMGAVRNRSAPQKKGPELSVTQTDGTATVVLSKWLKLDQTTQQDYYKQVAKKGGTAVKFVDDRGNPKLGVRIDAMGNIIGGGSLVPAAPKPTTQKPVTQPTQQQKPTNQPKDWDGFVSSLGTKFSNNKDLYNYLVNNRNALISTYGQQKMLDQLINDLKR